MFERKNAADLTWIESIGTAVTIILFLILVP